MDSEHNDLSVSYWSSAGRCSFTDSNRFRKVLFEIAIGEFFRNYQEAALQHPNWEMGNKITIDSATMMNKGLEVVKLTGFLGFFLKN